MRSGLPEIWVGGARIPHYCGRRCGAHNSPVRRVGFQSTAGPTNRDDAWSSTDVFDASVAIAVASVGSASFVVCPSGSAKATAANEFRSRTTRCRLRPGARRETRPNRARSPQLLRMPRHACDPSERTNTMRRTLRCRIALFSTLMTKTASAVGSTQRSALRFGFIKRTDMAPWPLPMKKAPLRRRGLDSPTRARGESRGTGGPEPGA